PPSPGEVSPSAGTPMDSQDAAPGEDAMSGEVPPSSESGHATVNRHHELLLGGPPELTVTELAARAGVEEQITRQYWRSLGFPDVPEDQKHFTETDVAALRDLAEAVEADTVSLTAAQDLVRGLGHSMDRL